MLRSYTGMILFLLFSPAGLTELQAQGWSDRAAVVFQQSEASTARRAVFAQFLSVVPNSEDPSLRVDSAISISNVCAAPSQLEFLITPDPEETVTEGRVALVLYDQDGTVTHYQTEAGSPGEGLTAGLLEPGGTWTVRLAEVLAAAEGAEESEVEFNGYGWVLSEFECLAGTYNNTIFGLGFTQNFELLPAMGEGGFFGGVPLPESPESDNRTLGENQEEE